MRIYGPAVAASNEYKPGTKVLAQSGDKKVVVTIAGSGPFIRRNGRWVPHPTIKLDLSEYAFRRLAFPSRGIVRGRYKAVTNVGKKS